MSANGPLARTVADAAVLLDGMAGPMPGDAVTAPPSSERFLDCARRDPGRLQIAVVGTPLLPAEIHPDCREAQRQTAELLVSLGHDVTEADLPAVAELADAFISVMSCIAAVPEVPDESMLMPFTQTLRAIAGGVSGQQLARALTTYQALTTRLASSLFTRHDMVLSPTLAIPPPAVGGLRDDQNQDAEFNAQASFMPFTPLYNPARPAEHVGTVAVERRRAADWSDAVRPARRRRNADLGRGSDRGGAAMGEPQTKDMVRPREPAGMAIPSSIAGRTSGRADHVQPDDRLHRRWRALGRCLS
jgi:hypothetical protein